MAKSHTRLKFGVHRQSMNTGNFRLLDPLRRLISTMLIGDRPPIYKQLLHYSIGLISCNVCQPGCHPDVSCNNLALIQKRT